MLLRTSSFPGYFHLKFKHFRVGAENQRSENGQASAAMIALSNTYQYHRQFSEPCLQTNQNNRRLPTDVPLLAGMRVARAQKHHGDRVLLPKCGRGAGVSQSCTCVPTFAATGHTLDTSCPQARTAYKYTPLVFCIPHACAIRPAATFVSRALPGKTISIGQQTNRPEDGDMFVQQSGRLGESRSRALGSRGTITASLPSGARPCLLHVCTYVAQFASNSSSPATSL